ncbi:MAG: hypothetical protein QXG71_00300 [Nanopusillaceae archaeon]
MDIGEFLNVILMFLIISFSIIITAKLAFLNMKYLTSLNPFTIYQIAVSINYFSSNIGEFSSLIDTPGMEFIEYRISSYSKGSLGYYPAYVSSGICILKDHLQEISVDAINALMYTIAGGAFAGIGKMPFRIDMIKAFLKVSFIEITRAYIFSKIFEGIFVLLPIFGSKRPMEMQEMLANFIRTKSYFSNPAKLADEIKNDFLSNYAETAGKVVLSGAIRMIITKALSSTGIGIVIAFIANFFIETIDNIVSIIRGSFDVEYNCLYSLIDGFGKQVIYNQMERIEYTPNLNIELNFIDVFECKSLSKYENNKIYKITGYQPCEDQWAYLLKNIAIYKNESKRKIIIWPSYEKVKK